MATIEYVEDGEWLTPQRGRYTIICCDCGLAHEYRYRLKDGKIEFQVVRNNRSTAAVRRHMKGKRATR